jgi:hypothetical protein
MPADVFFASPYQKALRAEETLPAKLDLVIAKLGIRDRVKDELVAIKMHLGGYIGYSTIHPVFVRRVVQAVKNGGGRPFVTDSPGSVFDAYTRGYTAETLGCPIVANQGATERYSYTRKKRFKNIREWQIGGHLNDATFLIDLAHAKGHPTCGFGGVFKNLALGGMAWPTRAAMHDVMHHDRYWFADKCPDAKTRKKIVESCPFGCLVQDKEHPEELHLHYDPCNQCGRCLRVAPEGALAIRKGNFQAFQEAMAISVGMILSTFDRAKMTFINIATNITPVCDCFGFTGPPILPDLGIFASDDPCAIEQATLECVATLSLIPENVPACMELQPAPGRHPIQVLHGPYKDPYVVIRHAAKLGLGSPEYTLTDVMPEASKGTFADQLTVSAQ